MGYHRMDRCGIAVTYARDFSKVYVVRSRRNQRVILIETKKKRELS